MDHHQTVDRLRGALIDADYTVDSIVDRIGEQGQRALGRNSTIAADRSLAGALDPQAVLIRLWLLQQPVPRAAALRALPGLTGPLVEAGLLTGDRDQIVAAVDVRPYASDDDGATGWVVSDLVNGLDAPAGPARADYVLGISPASTSLAQLTIREPVGSALDLGAGCGVQSLHLARHAKRVVATDLNPRANQLAAWTYGLTGVTVDQRLGSLYAPVAGEQFDLIVTNPPYVMSPPGSLSLSKGSLSLPSTPSTGSGTSSGDVGSLSLSKGSKGRLIYREGAMAADDLVATIVKHSIDHLRPGGTLQVLGNWAITDPDRWAERLQGWIPPGCDALIMERERLDPFEYIEVWLADEGLLGRPEYADRYRQWLDYFDSLGIIAVGMGWIQVHCSGTDHPDVRIEQWPHAVEQPVGSAFAEARQGVAYARRSDAELLATHWQLAPDIVTETIGQPGAEHPNHIVFRSQRGFRRAAEVDTALAGVLGACDGDLPLGAIITAVAGLLEVDADALAAELLPRIRTLLRDGMLRTHR